MRARDAAPGARNMPSLAALYAAPSAAYKAAHAPFLAPHQPNYIPGALTARAAGQRCMVRRTAFPS